MQGASEEDEGGLSSRAELWIGDRSGKIDYGLAQILSYGDIYHPEVNPDGALCMAIAENKFVGEMLLDKLNDFHASATGYTQEACNYTTPSGLPDVKVKVASFLDTFVFKGLDAGRVSPNHLILGSGCVGMLHQLAYLLFEEGEEVIIPTPYYPAFVKDFKALGKVDIVGAPCTLNKSNDLELVLTKGALEYAYNAGKSIKALLISNPTNPLGRCYTREELEMVGSFCKEKSIHLIVDEIYACSVFEKGAFTSFVEVYEENLRQGRELMPLNNMHFVWSMSKDFGGSGLRFGVCYTRNVRLLQAMNGMSDMMMISNLAQQTIGYLLADHDFCRRFIGENQRLLRECYTVLKTGLLGLGLGIIEAHSGIFAFVDLRNLLRTPKNKFVQEGEEELEQRLRQRKVYLTPGAACKCPYPGFFRVCYAWMSVAAVKELLFRLAAEKQAFNDDKDSMRIKR